jgi:hypothetical protein
MAVGIRTQEGENVSVEREREAGANLCSKDTLCKHS